MYSFKNDIDTAYPDITSGILNGYNIQEVYSNMTSYSKPRLKKHKTNNVLPGFILNRSVNQANIYMKPATSINNYTTNSTTRTHKEENPVKIKKKGCGCRR